jgi:iron complex transport system ATP-binding protein
MEKKSKEILFIDSLKIGYVSGKTENVLLPPLTASAASGELIAVIGRNGIGKSTLLRTLTGLQKPLGGDIFYSGKNIRDFSRMELAQNVGYISTEIVKVSNMRVYDLVALGRFPHTNWTGKIEMKDHEIISDSLKMTSMESFAGKLVSELSDGERQKSMIARILAQDTGIMIMDEPTAFLDVAGRYEVLHLMHILSANNDKTIIFSTHDLQMAISQSDKIWLILENKLIEGAPEDLMIAGAFDNLFDSSSVQFNSEDGTFSFRSDNKGSIFIEGGGNKRHWTEKALNRAGYTISKEKTFPFVVLPSDNSDLWQLTEKSAIREFNSIYELILYLSKDAAKANKNISCNDL